MSPRLWKVLLLAASVTALGTLAGCAPYPCGEDGCPAGYYGDGFGYYGDGYYGDNYGDNYGDGYYGYERDNVRYRTYGRDHANRAAASAASGHHDKNGTGSRHKRH